MLYISVVQLKEKKRIKCDEEKFRYTRNLYIVDETLLDNITGHVCVSMWHVQLNQMIK